MLRDEIGRLRARLTGRSIGWTWALQDVSLMIAPGESMGLVGLNGSGKSTLLKILTRVMYPYAGHLDVKGRVGALIEVRAGIHPELTGRENVFLYGSLLGLSRRNVAGRFDDIIAFAELEAAIDRQVKFYSSGMQMRLGFAVAAFLEPDILLVDEVLAVGDAAFQQRCLDRMRTVLEQGTTLVFVSHDLPAVQATCSRGIWLNAGRVMADGSVEEVVTAYRRSIEEAAEVIRSSDGPVSFVKAELVPSGQAARTGESLSIRMVLRSMDERPARLYLGITEGPASPVFTLRKDVSLTSGDLQVDCEIERLPLPRGRYYVWAGIFGRTRRTAETYAGWQPVTSFDVIGPDLDEAPGAVVRLAPVYVEASWTADPL